MDIQQTFQTWVNALARPGGDFFAAEREKSSASLSTALIWVIVASVIGGLLSALRSSVFPSTTGGFDQVVDMLPAEVQGELGAVVETGASGGTAFDFASIILGPIFFIIGVGIYHIVASILGGNGQFGRYAYLTATFAAPLVIVTSILGFIPVLGGCLAALLAIYRLVLTYHATKIEYGLTEGRAIMVVLTPVLAGLVLGACVVAFALSAILSLVGSFG